MVSNSQTNYEARQRVDDVEMEYVSVDTWLTLNKSVDSPFLTLKLSFFCIMV